MFQWFNAQDAEAIGAKLADFYASRVPSHIEANKKTFAKQVDVIQKTLSQAQLLKQGVNLNIYKKAKLGNTFKWKLLDLGYDKEFVDEFTREIILALK